MTYSQTMTALLASALISNATMVQAADDLTDKERAEILNAWETDLAAKDAAAMAKFEGMSSTSSGKFSLGELDLALPETPAFSVLNVDAAKANRPTSARELAFHLLEGTDDNGNLQSGIAIDFSPLLALEQDMSLADYRGSGNYFNRLLARSQVSIGTIKGTNSDEDKSVKASVGLSTTLFDFGDLRVDDKYQTECADFYLEKETAIASATAPLIVDNTINSKDALLKAAEEKASGALGGMSLADYQKLPVTCLKEARERLWNASAMSVGIASIWFSDSGGVGDLDSEGLGVWASLAYGFENFGEESLLRKNAQFVIHARYLSDEKVLDQGQGNNNFIEQDKKILAAQLRIAMPDLNVFGRSEPLQGGPDWTFFADYAYIEEDRTNVADEELSRYAFGVESKIDDGTYLKISIGSEDGRERGSDEGFVMGRLKINLSNPN